MKVLLLKPEFRNVFTRLSLIVTEPLELEYMSSICKKNDTECLICDLTIGNSLKKALNGFNPDIVCMTANFVHINSIKKYVKKIKDFNPNILTIVGGPHAEVIPDDFKFEGIDIVTHSGGFTAFETIIREGINVDLSAIKGIDYQKDGVWYSNERTVFNANELPFPDRTHFNKYKRKYKYVTMRPCAIIKTAYSCPCNCNYCFSTLLNGGKYMCREPENVIEELKQIECNDIWIVDDTFYVNTEKLDRFIELVKENNIKKNFSLYYRADFIASHPEHMKKLAEIGVSMCAVGLEVIDDEILKKYNKNSSVHIINNALKVLNDCNITCIGLLMIDIDADKEYFKKVYKFIKDYELFLSTISILTPMPGTGQYEKYKDRIMTSDYRKWDFVHLTINPTKMSRMGFYARFYLLYVKMAWNIAIRGILPLKYIFAGVRASFDYWYEAIFGIKNKSEVNKDELH